MKKQIYYFGIFLSFVSCIYFVYYFHKNFSAIPPIRKGTYTYLYFCFAILLSSLPVIFGGLGWTLILRALREPVSIKDGVIIYTISQFGKYLPGNFGHHLGRISLSVCRGLNFSRVFFAMLLEIFLSSISGFVLLVITILSLNKKYTSFFSIKIQNNYELIVFLSILAILLFLISLVFYKKFNKSFFCLILEEFLCKKNISILSTNIIFHTFNFFCMGIVMKLLSVGIFNSSQGNIFVLTGIFSTAWFIGFITPGAPAGLGIRETILVTALEPFYGPAIALGISAFLRIITTFSDGLTFVTAFAIKKWVFKFSPESQ